ncbi:sugar ABC transporter permease [Oceanobacillus timonensis]|uniref:sugar ABC transporter permease n=1 Tax=Oceanobacillus timonensis TaxID=1926285 RepID=UPI0009BB774E|nr:sugar ABC transporter permease [Oceanobacillus timonensis]
MNPKTKSKIEVFFMYLFLALMFIVIVYPLLWTLAFSFNSGTNLYGASIIPESWSLAHYKWLFFDPQSNYVQWYINTLIIAFSTSIAATATVGLTAYAFSRYRFVGKKNGLYLFLVLQLFPVLMAMVAIYILLNTVGLLDSLFGLILVYVGTSIPMNAFLVKGYLDTIPKELDESAKLDGAGHFRILFQIVLPLAKPILAVVALFNFMTPFMDFILPRILLRSPENYTLALGLFNFVSDQFANNFTRFAAGAVLIALPIAAVFLYLQRYLISGLSSGATKG